MDLHPTTGSTCADFGESTDMSHSSSDLWLGFDHQAVLDGDAQMALYPFLDLEIESLPPNSCPGQHKETTPRDPWEPSLFSNDVDIDGDHEDDDEDVCPCARKDSSRKGFFLRELLDDSCMYIGYSFGDRSYKEWSLDWKCHPNPLLVKDTFVFAVHKTGDRMDIEFMSWTLYDFAYLMVHGERPTPEISIQTRFTLDGFLLLQNYNKLSSFLKSLEAGTLRDELFLLVVGFLGDHESLSSFGHQDLFEKGHISFERWKSIQHSLIEDDLDMIESGVQAAIGEEEALRSGHQRKVWEILLGDGHPQNFENSEAEQRRQDNLQGQHSLEVAWLTAVINGSLSKVREMLKASRAMPLFDLDMIADESWGRYSGMTGLMIAVVRGNAKLVHSLLAAGVEANMLTTRGTALSLAAKSDSRQIIQLLLAKNARLEDAISVLSAATPTPIQTGSDAKRLQAIQTLEELAMALPKEKESGDLLRQLHSEFSSSHAHISETIRKATTRQTAAAPARVPAPVSPSGNVEGVLPSWAQGIERLKRPAWKAGMRILRKLTRGQVSRKVGEVVMLLTIVNSMSAVLDFRDGESSDLATKFSDDLTRWQWLFNSEDGSLQNFRDAVHILWEVRLSTDDSILDMPPGVDQLTSMLFQVMAMNMMAKISPILHSQDNGDLGNGGLLASQSRWKANHRKPSCGPRNFGTEHGEGVRTSTPSGCREDDPNEFSRRFSMLQRSPVVEFEPIVLVLASGAIFGILLLFFIILRSLSPNTGSGQMPSAIYNQVSLQMPVLRAGFQHIIYILQASTVLSSVHLSQMKSSMETAISQGLVSSFPSLINHLLNHTLMPHWDLTTTHNVQSQLHSINTHWSATYSLQQNYRALEVYLGFKQFVHIVPMNQLPTLSVHEAISTDIPLEAAEMDITFSNEGISSDTPSNSPIYKSSLSPLTISPNTTHSSSSTSTPQSLTNTTRTPRNTFCHDCDRDYGKVYNYNKHRKDKHEKAEFPCRIPGCKKVLSRNHYRKVHERSQH